MMSADQNIRRGIVPPPLDRVLAYGMSGKDVAAAQTLLKENGFFQGSIGGNFLDATRSAVLNFQMTHINEDGKFLDVDGEIYLETWWALHNASGSAQRSFIPAPEQPMFGGESPRGRVLDKLTALYRGGVVEIPDGSNYGPDGSPLRAIVNACGFNHGIYWCLAIQSFVEREANGKAPFGKMHVGCMDFWREAMKWQMAHFKRTYSPIPGDIAIWQYLGKNGRPNGSGHAARVARVSKDGKQMNLFEGNAGNRLKFSKRTIADEPTLLGFVNLYGDATKRPNFETGLIDAPTLAIDYASTR